MIKYCITLPKDKEYYNMLLFCVKECSSYFEQDGIVFLLYETLNEAKRDYNRLCFYLKPLSDKIYIMECDQNEETLTIYDRFL